MSVHTHKSQLSACLFAGAKIRFNSSLYWPSTIQNYSPHHWVPSLSGERPPCAEKSKYSCCIDYYRQQGRPSTIDTLNGERLRGGLWSGMHLSGISVSGKIEASSWCISPPICQFELLCRHIIYLADVGFIACWQDWSHSQSCRLSDLAWIHLPVCNLLSDSQLHALKTVLSAPPPALFFIHLLLFVDCALHFSLSLCSNCHLSSLLFKPSPFYYELRSVRDDLRELAAFNCLPGAAYLVWPILSLPR